VSTIIKTCVGRIGHNPKLYSAGSLRKGFLVEALRAGVRPDVILEQTDLHSLSSLRPYNNLARTLGYNDLRHAFQI
jgi:hypothetical protein